MATAVVMPKLGQSVETCIIIGWKKRKGDAIAEGEPPLRSGNRQIRSWR